MPACGPPSNLSPLKQTTSTPARSDAATVGSPWNASRSMQGPTAQVVGHQHPLRLAQFDQFGQLRLFGETQDAVVGGVHAQQQGGLRR